MKHACIAVAALAASACQASADAGPSPFTSQDLSDIRAASAQWVETYNRNDWPELATLFTTNAVMMPPNSGSVTGRDNIATWQSEYESGFRIAFQIGTIDGDGDIAYVRGRSCVFIPDETGNYAVDVGKFLEVRRRQADGQWLIEADAFNSDMPAGSDLADSCPFAPLPSATD
ncbi:MAG: DUF4440 domain-containing protein [Litorimonas sp.]